MSDMQHLGGTLFQRNFQVVLLLESQQGFGISHGVVEGIVGIGGFAEVFEILEHVAYQTFV
jgi:hypothetical protein